jgi:4-hydroxy-2-oxoheptanedioate aldolase
VRENSLKTRWRAGESALGLWLATPDPAAVEPLGQVGYDYICLDLQHGLIGYESVVPILQALSRSASIPLARAPWNEPGIIGKLLDAGAMGVILPMVNDRDQAVQAVRSCRYPPNGARSWGPTRANPALGGGYHDDANAQIACIPMIETREAVEHLDDILSVDGVDAVYVGPADLAVSYGLPPATDHPDSPVYQEALATIVERCRAHDVIPGIHTVPTMVQTRLDQGFRMVTVTSNLIAQLDGARYSLETARSTASGPASGGSMY